MGNSPVKLLDKVRQCIRLKGYSIRTEKSYVSWIKRFILFHGKRHPQDMGKPEIEAFLSDLVMKHNVASSTQNQAFNAILFLYNHVLDADMPEDINALRSKKPVRVPTVMTREETLKVIGMLHGTHQLMGKLIYGCGLRVMECIRLRVKDIDFAMNQIVVRDGKGQKDRITVLPDGVKSALIEHLVYVKRLHQDDLARGYGRVYLPHALKKNTRMQIGSGGGSMLFPRKRCRKIQDLG